MFLGKDEAYNNLQSSFLGWIGHVKLIMTVDLCYVTIHSCSPSSFVVQLLPVSVSDFVIVVTLMMNGVS